MEFKYPYCLLLLLLCIPYIIWNILKFKKSLPSISIPNVTKYNYVRKSWRIKLIYLPSILHLIFFSCIVLVLARPQMSNSSDNYDIEGIDIMLSVDISTSMLTQDFKPNRVRALKSIAKDFINKRPNDNIGLTVFAGEAFTQCPLTTDHNILVSLYDAVDEQMAAHTGTSGGIIEDGTAIGDGIMNSLLRLRESKTKSKVIILLTDGVNNCGKVSPLTAAKIAKKQNVRVYTIGIGRNGSAPFPTQGGTLMVPVEIDENTMKQISEETGGKYFRAQENKDLSEIYDEIDQMERSKLSSTLIHKRKELYEPFAFVALLSLIFEILLNMVVIRRLP